MTDQEKRPETAKGTVGRAVQVGLIMLSNEDRLAILNGFCNRCGEENDRCECEVRAEQEATT